MSSVLAEISFIYGFPIAVPLLCPPVGVPASLPASCPLSSRSAPTRVEHDDGGQRSRRARPRWSIQEKAFHGMEESPRAGRELSGKLHVWLEKERLQ